MCVSIFATSFPSLFSSLTHRLFHHNVQSHPHDVLSAETIGRQIIVIGVHPIVIHHQQQQTRERHQLQTLFINTFGSQSLMSATNI